MCADVKQESHKSKLRQNTHIFFTLDCWDKLLHLELCRDGFGYIAFFTDNFSKYTRPCFTRSKTAKAVATQVYNDFKSTFWYSIQSTASLWWKPFRICHTGSVERSLVKKVTKSDMEKGV